MGRAVLTYEDYAALPDDGRRYELHDVGAEAGALPPFPDLVVSFALVMS